MHCRAPQTPSSPRPLWTGTHNQVASRMTDRLHGSSIKLWLRQGQRPMEGWMGLSEENNLHRRHMFSRLYSDRNPNHPSPNPSPAPSEVKQGLWLSVLGDLFTKNAAPSVSEVIDFEKQSGQNLPHEIRSTSLISSEHKLPKTKPEHVFSRF